MPFEKKCTPAAKTTKILHASLRIALPAIVLGVTALAWSLGWHRHLTLDAVATNRDWLQALIVQHQRLSMLVYTALYIAIVGLSLPGGTVLTLTGGLLFGWLGGAIAAVVGATAGATIIFLVARSAIGDVLESRAGPHLQKICDGFQQNAFNYVLFLRLIPAFPFWLVNLAPAMLGIPLRAYFFGTLLGIVPGTVAIASVGAGLDAVIAAAKADQAACVAAHGEGVCSLSISMGALMNPQLVAALVLLAFVALLPVLVRRHRRTESN